MKIIFGPSGLGPVKEAINRLEEFNELGLKACEIAFTYGVYIKEKDAILIGKKAKELSISLSIHAHYWINLNSKDKIKIEQSKKRILDCCEIGEKLKATRVVFHPGYYQGMDKEESYNNIKQAILDIQDNTKKNKWKIKLAPETTGKVNVFGSIEEISQLVNETKCSFCLDFAHIKARDKKIEWEKIKKLFPQKHWHCHFSGIEYSEKGEKRHIITKEKDIKNLLENLPKNKEITIINESPNPIEDSIKSARLLK